MKKQVKIIIFVVILLVIVIGIVTIVNNNNNNNNKERRVNDYCNKYGLYGNFVYNNKIEIKNIVNCSDVNLTKYKKIDGTLFLREDNGINVMDTLEYNEDKAITIEYFLKNNSFKMDNFLDKCYSYKDNLYIEVKVETIDDKIEMYEIPILYDGKCK